MSINTKKVVNVRPANDEQTRFFCTIITQEGFGLPCVAFVNDDKSLGVVPQQRKGKDDKYYNVFSAFTKVNAKDLEGNDIIASVNLLDSYIPAIKDAIAKLKV